MDNQSIPSLDTIYNFFYYIYKKTQLNSECIIMTMIYLERLIKTSKNRFCINHSNWKSVLYACMIMSSKVWDDLSMWNIDFSHVLPSFDLHRVNELELALLDALNFIVIVSAGEYARYYFYLRSMMARLGFHTNETMVLGPLNIADARKLQISTEEYQLNKSKEKEINNNNNNNNSNATTPIKLNNSNNSPSNSNEKQYVIRRANSEGSHINELPHTPVSIEKIVHTAHVDADGITHHSHSTHNKSSPYSPSP